MPLIREKIKRKIAVRPEAILLANFATIILIGWLLLLLPISRVPGKVPAVDALFTSASAVCVTGLITVDTATAYTIFGKVVILCLIQIGGLGLMTFAALIFTIVRRRLSYGSQVILEDTFFQDPIAAEFKNLFKKILLLTATIEGSGFILIYVFLPSSHTGLPRLFSSLFHSVSAFCNAGLSIYTENLSYVKSSYVVLIIVMILIISGGIGYSVLTEIFNRAVNKSYKQIRVRWSLNSKVVIRATLILIIGGALLLFVMGLTKNEKELGDRMFHSLFQSVTARTAGFNTVNIRELKDPPLIILIMLMFIGGSPGGTAGGIKTATAAVILAVIFSGLRRSEDVKLMDRRIPSEVIQRAIVVVSLATFLNLAGIIILTTSEGGGNWHTIDLMFEQISAFGTVGLSSGVTPTLSFIGKMWIILTMYIGRVGPLTVALWFTEREKVKIKYPEERIMIG